MLTVNYPYVIGKVVKDKLVKTIKESKPKISFNKNVVPFISRANDITDDSTKEQGCNLFVIKHGSK